MTYVDVPIWTLVMPRGPLSVSKVPPALSSRPSVIDDTAIGFVGVATSG